MLQTLSSVKAVYVKDIVAFNHHTLYSQKGSRFLKHVYNIIIFILSSMCV